MSSELTSIEQEFSEYARDYRDRRNNTNTDVVRRRPTPLSRRRLEQWRQNRNPSSPSRIPGLGNLPGGGRFLPRALGGALALYELSKWLFPPPTARSALDEIDPALLSPSEPTPGSGQFYSLEVGKSYVIFGTFSSLITGQVGTTRYWRTSVSNVTSFTLPQLVNVYRPSQGEIGYHFPFPNLSFANTSTRDISQALWSAKSRTGTSGLIVSLPPPTSIPRPDGGYTAGTLNVWGNNLIVTDVIEIPTNTPIPLTPTPSTPTTSITLVDLARPNTVTPTPLAPTIRLGSPVLNSDQDPARATDTPTTVIPSPIPPPNNDPDLTRILTPNGLVPPTLIPNPQPLTQGRRARTRTPSVGAPSPTPSGGTSPNPSGLPNPDAIPDPDPATPTPTPSSPCDTGCVGGIRQDIQNMGNNIGNQISDRVAQQLAALFSAGDLLGTAEILRRLGEPLPGGLSGWLTRFKNVLKVDRILNALNTLLLIHNAAMLSKNLLGSIGDLTSSFLNNIMNLVKDEDDSAIDINATIGNTVENFIKSIVGEQIYNDVSSTWKSYNRIYQAAANILDNTMNALNGLAEGLELIGKYGGRVGNALKSAGVVLNNAYDWMSETIQIRTGRLGAIQKVIDGLEQVENIASDLESASANFVEVADSIEQIQQESNAIRLEIARLEQEKTESENESDESSQSPDINNVDLIKPREDN